MRIKILAAIALLASFTGIEQTSYASNTKEPEKEPFMTTTTAATKVFFIQE